MERKGKKETAPLTERGLFSHYRWLIAFTG